MEELANPTNMAQISPYIAIGYSAVATTIFVAISVFVSATRNRRNHWK